MSENRDGNSENRSRRSLSGRGSRRLSRGFTLIELLGVVAILGIVSAMATPYYIGHLRNYRARNDANGIASLMSIARMRASSDFARAAVSCDSSVTPAVCKLYTVQSGSAAAATACTLSTWTQEPQQYRLSATVTFAVPTGVTAGVSGQSTITPAQVYPGQVNPYTIYFNSRGWPVDCNGSPRTNYALYVKDLPGTFSMAVGVDPSGRSQVYILTGTSYWAVKD
jgi:prepilin-type N-terminal cleavage/methylation domain-containing protein